MLWRGIHGPAHPTRPDRDHDGHQQTGSDRHRRDSHGIVHNTQGITRNELHHSEGLHPRIAFIARFLGRRIAYTYKVRDVAPDERFVMSATEGPFPMQTTYTWEDTPSGDTRMTLRNVGEPRGFGKVAAPVMSAAMRRANQQNLSRLKEILEAGGDQTATPG